MANVSKTGTPTISTPAPTKESLLTGLLAGEALAGGDAVYVKTSDGALWIATGAALNEAAEAIGLVCTPASAGEPATVALFGSGIMFGYGPNVSGTATAAGTALYLGTGGALANAATTGGIFPVAWAVGDGRICLQTPPWAMEIAVAALIAAIP